MKKRIIPILIIISLVLINTSFCVNSYADSQVAFYIKHVHNGDEAIGSGCYSSPIYHSHSEEGGPCYSPIYHTHEGDPSIGDGCYTVPVLHHHTGDSSAEGGCYVPRYHSHTQDCYQTLTCQINESITNTYYESSYCGYHGNITAVSYEITHTHSACGVVGSYIVTGCPLCGIDIPTGPDTHEYSYLACYKSSSTIDGYQIGCGHEEGGIDHYDIGCGLEGTIVGYELTCTKTSDDIDGYTLGCGFSEGDSIAKVVVDNDGNGQSSEVNVTAHIEDLTGGKIDFSEATIIWHDNEGNDIGEGQSVSINQNGTYEVEVVFDNPSVDQSSLRGDVTVNNIYIPSENTDGNEIIDNSDIGEGGTNEIDGMEDNLEEIQTPIIDLADLPNLDMPELIVENPVSKIQKENKIEEEIISLDTKDNKPVKDKVTVLTNIAYDNTSSPIEMKTIEEPISDGGFLKKIQDFIKSPKGKVITISLGTALGLGLLFGLLYLLRNVVIVFNDDTDRKRHVLGFIRVTRQEDGYCIDIPKSISQKAYTNRYAFFMKLFMIGRSSDTKILISLEDKRISVKLTGIIETII